MKNKKIQKLLKLVETNPSQSSEIIQAFIEEDVKKQMTAKRLRSMKLRSDGGIALDPNIPSYASKEDGEKAIRKLKNFKKN